MSEPDHLHDGKACNHEEPPDNRCVWCGGKGWHENCDNQRYACSDCDGRGYVSREEASRLGNIL